MSNIWLFIFLMFGGGLGGMISSILGIGGGMFYVAVFVLYFNYFDLPINPVMISINSLACIFFSTLVSLIRLLGKKQIRLQHFWLPSLFASLSILSVLFSFTLLKWYDKELYKIFFILISIVLLIYFIISRKFKYKTDPIARYKSNKHSIWIASIGGVFSALSGLGGGILMTPLWVRVCKLNIKKASNISLSVICFSSLSTILFGVYHNPEFYLPTFHIGLFLPWMILPTMLGSLMGIFMGFKIQKRLSDYMMNLLFAAVILIVITIFFWSE